MHHEPVGSDRDHGISHGLDQQVEPLELPVLILRLGLWARLKGHLGLGRERVWLSDQKPKQCDTRECDRDAPAQPHDPAVPPQPDRKARPDERRQRRVAAELPEFILSDACHGVSVYVRIRRLG